MFYNWYLFYYYELLDACSATPCHPLGTVCNATSSTSRTCSCENDKIAILDDLDANGCSNGKIFSMFYEKVFSLWFKDDNLLR